MCWDIRNTQTCVATLPRCSDTSQRIGFDVEPLGRHLVTGSRDNRAIVYDLHTAAEVCSIADPAFVLGEGGSCVVSAVCRCPYPCNR
jgi:WD40 repeat protein